MAVLLQVADLFSKWTEIGPCGGWVTCMKSLPQNPQRMYCGILQGGAFYSDDRGDNWQLIAAIGEYNPVYDLSISSDGTVYFATNHGLFVSRNSGSTWEQLFKAPTWQVIALSDRAVAADTARMQYSGGVVQHRSNSSWLISFDYGANWRFWEGTVDSSIIHPDYLFAHEKRGNMIVTADSEIFRIEGLRIFKTRDKNWTEWQHVNDLDPLLYEWSRAFLVATEAAATCYAFAEYYDFHPISAFYGGIFQSNDNWQSWKRLPKINSATALAQKGAYLFIGESEGVTYNTNSKLILYNTAVDSAKQLGQFGGDIVAIDATTWDRGEIIVATESGIYKTTNFGATWKNSSKGIHRINAVAVQSLPINEHSERIILAVNKGGIWSSEDCGISWECETIVPYVLPGLLQKARYNPQYLYAGGFKFFRSRDSGNLWFEPEPYHFPAYYYGWYGRFIDMAIDPLDPKHIMVHFDDHSKDHRAGVVCAESYDRGTSWAERIWFSGSGNRSQKAIFDSTNKRLWLSKQGSSTATPALMVIDSTWQNPVRTISLPRQSIASFWCVLGDTIFVMNSRDAIFFRSDDLGETWFENDLGNFNYNYFWYDWAVYEQLGQLTLSPDGQRIFFVYPGTGVLYSKDRGVSWRVLNEGLPTFNTYHLDFSNLNPNIIYLATDHGCYQFDLLTCADCQNENTYQNRPARFSIKSFPNPFNSETTISFFLDRPGKLMIKIYNLLGQEVEQLIDQPLIKAGSYQFHWEATNATSGVFVIKVTFDGTTYTKKILLLK
ncbi:MAG: T9SS type A sorting domain-containing protein [candidate division KSB1 bacterium]|nr:T9SS type A sorting domain-containing protein [candidate division KSB1 bacterium]